jgi:hypothetical protein
VLWIQTDVSTSVLNKGDYANIGNNQMLAADPATGYIRRFLTGPNGCEITGVVMAPDGKTMFVNIQRTASCPARMAGPVAVRRTRQTGGVLLSLPGALAEPHARCA